VNIDSLTGPVIHAGIPAVLAFLFRLNPAVAIFCGILPDLVDKPLAALGIGGGRYVGHTLLFAVVVVILFTIKKRKYGIAALVGLVSHFLLDLNALIPWFFPFKNYQFFTTRLSVIDWLKGYLSFSQAGLELIAVAVVGAIAFFTWWLYRRNIRLKK
jgi:hypothetical protein